MDRKVIPIQVSDEYVRGDGVSVGAAGSHDDVALRLAFGPMWAGTARSIVWYDANGENPIITALTTDLLEAGEEEVYLVPIPAEPKAVAGEMTMTIKGATASGSREMTATLTATARFHILESAWSEDAEQGGDITATQAEQFQAEIEQIKSDIVEASTSAVAAKKSEQAAAESAQAAEAGADEAAKSAQAAEASAQAAAAAKTAAEAAETGAENAKTAAVTAKTAAMAAQTAAEAAEAGAESAKDAAVTAQTAAQTAKAGAEAAQTGAQSARDTAVAAQSGAETAQAAALAAQTGAEAARTDAESAKTAAAAAKSAAEAAMAGAEAAQTAAEAAVGKTSYIGENGNWYAWNAQAGAFLDTGTAATGPQGPKGETGAQGPKGETGAQGPAGPGSGDMLGSVYDPQGKAEDVFAYTDTRISQEKITGQAGQTVMIGQDGHAEAVTQPSFAGGAAVGQSNLAGNSSLAMGYNNLAGTSVKVKILAVDQESKTLTLENATLRVNVGDPVVLEDGNYVTAIHLTAATVTAIDPNDRKVITVSALGINPKYAYAIKGDANGNLAVGKWNTATGQGGLAAGKANQTRGEGSAAIGVQNYAASTGAVATGTGSSAVGENAVAMGNYASANGPSAAAIGDGVAATGEAAISCGYGTVANDYQFVCGYQNVESPVEDVGKGNLVIVGNGLNDPSNAHTLDWDGNAWYAGKVSAGTAESPAAVESANDLTTKQYVDALADGKADLDAAGKVPAAQLPELDYVPAGQKGTANGVATLDEDGKVPGAQLSIAATQPPVVTTAGTGEAYTAEVPGVTELYPGLMITIVPHTSSTTTAPTLEVNGLGAKGIRRYLSSNTIGTTSAKENNWLRLSKPVLLQYTNGFWTALGTTKPAAGDLFGLVPIANGGTGAATAAAARTNLEITAANTPISAALAEQYGVTDTPNVEAALAGLEGASSTGKVGSILCSTRTDLGDKWLLCNGEKLEADQYPQLSGFLRKMTQVNLYDALSDYGVGYGIAHDNGIWAIVGHFWPKSSSSEPTCCLTATAPGGPWTITQIASNGYVVRDIACYNGMWVAVGWSVSNSYPYIWYTEDPTGTWTEKQLSSSDTISLTCVYCYNGTWVAGGYRSNYPCIFTTTSVSGTWNQVQVSTSILGRINAVTCYNGTWVLVGGRGSYNKFIATTTTPSGSWTIDEDGTIPNLCLTDVACHDGKWIIAGYRENPSGSSNPYVLTASDPSSGTWTATQVSSTEMRLTGITHCDGNWVGIGGVTGGATGYIVKAVDPEGLWRVIPYACPVSNGWAEPHKIASDGTVWAAPVSDNYKPSPYVIHNDNCQLPLISLDETYTYIRAKE